MVIVTLVSAAKITQLFPQVLHVYLSHSDAMYLFLHLPSWFLPYVGSLMASSVRALAFTALYSSLLPDGRNDLLS